MEKLYTVNDVAEYLNLTTRTIQNYIKRGTLAGSKVGKGWRFTEQDIKDYLELTKSLKPTKEEILAKRAEYRRNYRARNKQ